MQEIEAWPLYQGRLNKISVWLAEKFSSIWVEALEARGLFATNNCTKLQLTELALVSNYVIRTLSEEGFEAAVAKLERLPLISSIEAPGFSETRLLLDNETLRSDLRRVQHPSLPEGSISPLSNDKTHNLLGELERASEILDMFPDLKCDAQKYLSAICFVGSPKLQERGECISTSSKLVPGLIYSSDVPAILLGEAILHEATHLKLFCHEIRIPLYLDDDCSISTPLRPDMRPPAGLLHQVFVLKKIFRYYDSLSRASHPVIEQNREKILKRLSNIQREHEEGVELLKANRSRYSPHGCFLIEELLDG